MSETELNVLMDSLSAEVVVPVEVLVVEGPVSDAELPVWSSATEALVAEYSARTGGAR
ncbi:MAG: hypothetical protein HOW97_39760 [Catenulispora sp.]|nr:hypothetical protein [Catenulispora sp.]NUS29165.1 hypothetical protein [Streptomyces sp.]